MDEWGENVENIHSGMLPAIKRNEILSFVTAEVKLEGIMLSKICQAKKDKYCMISLIYEIKDNHNKEKHQTHRHRKQAGGCQRWGLLGEGGVGEMDTGSLRVQASTRYKISKP